ncbi:cytochrome P450 [Amycolatopsis sp. DG1A-15b]|uniref:cytochrome P450 n=1 Tax=Amycolatopsis sp. DG1A-15b TaxID=3052846 RepID=UPI00255C06E8|nr:cytochrome P450 [Amycolatopsis sp. DG1A-15b]WIX91426.1 cytochrome P450 [Amycolatopsis sp. DG1A-15b]
MAPYDNRDSKPHDPYYEPLSPEVIADPHPFYRRLREAHPVYWHGMLDSWVVTGHAAGRQVLTDTTRYASDFRRAGIDVPNTALSLQRLDPPDHTRIRHLLVTALHELPLRTTAEHLRAVMTARLTALAGTGPADLVTGFARPVALETICGYLGVRPPDGVDFELQSNAIVRSMDAGLDPSRAEAGIRARAALSSLVAGWLADDDRSGFVAAARRAQQAQPEITEDLLANSLRAILHAGYESSSRLLGAALLRLARQPALLDLLATPEGADDLADEIVRLDGSVQADGRVCVADGELGGRRIRRGQVVIVLLAAANRDPAVFPSPDEVNPRPRRGRHLGLGRGAHACLGAALVRQQLQTLFGCLRHDGFTITSTDRPRWEDTATLRGLTSLPAEVSARRTATAAGPHPIRG